MSENNSNLNSVVIPFVGTLNDNDMAHPVFFLDENKDMCEALVETPEIQHRKELARNYLRYLPVRFLQQDKEKQQKLLLYAIFVTRNWHSIDATNVLDLIQNAGNKIIWNDDSQFIGVDSQRFVGKYTRPETERTIVYVKAVSEVCQDRISYRKRCFNLIIDDYKKKYDLSAYFQKYFDVNEISLFRRQGFWHDKRFLEIPALAANYQQWFVKHYANGSGK